eukprot:4343371-Amphidinium_carterae.2
MARCVNVARSHNSPRWVMVGSRLNHASVMPDVGSRVNSSHGFPLGVASNPCKQVVRSVVSPCALLEPSSDVNDSCTVNLLFLYPCSSVSTHRGLTVSYTHLRAHETEADL